MLLLNNMSMMIGVIIIEALVSTLIYRFSIKHGMDVSEPRRGWTLGGVPARTLSLKGVYTGRCAKKDIGPQGGL